MERNLEIAVSDLSEADKFLVPDKDTEILKLEKENNAKELLDHKDKMIFSLQLQYKTHPIQVYSIPIRPWDIE